MTELQDRILVAMETEGDRTEQFTAPELAKMLDESSRTIRYNLTSLADEGRIHQKKHTARTTTYWL